MTAVAHRAVTGRLAAAEEHGPGLLRLEPHRRQTGARMLAVTEGLVFAAATGTPPILFACLNFNGKRCFLRDNSARR